MAPPLLKKNTGINGQWGIILLQILAIIMLLSGIGILPSASEVLL